MKKNKKLILSFLALNAVLPISASGAESSASLKYDRLYNSVIKNLEAGKSNEKNYKLIEKVLSQRNKELKDLYLQSDYIVKPEYLEWQIFFSGFYEEHNEGRDNTGENAEYYSKVNGYYETDGSYTVTSANRASTSGKPYQPLQKPKEIDLGVNVPISGITRPPLELNISPNSGSNVTGNYGPVTIAAPSVSPGIAISNFQPANPNVSILAPFVITPVTFTGTGFGQGTSNTFTPGGNPPMENYSYIISNTTANLNTGGTFSGDISYGDSLSSLSNWNSSTASGTPAAFYSAAADKRITISGEWNVTHATAGQTMFISYNPYEVGRGGSTGAQFMEFAGTLNLNNTGTGSLIGIEHQVLSGGGGGGSAFNAGAFPVVVNSGTINIDNGTRMLGIMIDREFATTDFVLPSQTYNTGKIELKANSSQSIGIDFGQYGNGALNTDAYVGDIVVDGTENYGVRVYDVHAGNLNYYDNIRVHGEKSNPLIYGAGGDGLIHIKGTKNIGIAFVKKIGASGYVDNVSNLNILVDGNEGIGILRSGDYVATQTANILLTGSQLKSLMYGDNSNQSILVRSDRFTTVIDPTLGANIGSNVGGTVTLGGIVKNGNDNILFLANGTGQTAAQAGKIINNSDITVTSDAKNAKTLVAYQGGEITNNAVMTNNSTRDRAVGSTNVGALGMALLGSSSIGTNSNTGKLLLQNTGTKLSVGVYNEGTFTNNGEIEVYGSEGIGVYSQGAASITNLTNKILVNGDNSVGLFSDNTNSSNFSVGSLTLNVNGTDAYAFYAKNGGGFNITGNTAVNVGAGGIGFQYVGTGLTTSISPTQITSMFNAGGGHLTFNLDPNSYAMVIENAQIKTSEIGTFTAIMPSHVTMSGSNKVKLYKGHLEIDENSNIDSAAATDIKYRDLPIASSRITLNSGKTISGTESGLAGIGQENDNIAGITNAQMLLTNNGTITLTGANSTGMYASYGSLDNALTGKIQTASGGVGLYGTNGTITANSGIIEFGDGGIGIYGTNVTPGTTPTYGTKDVSITHSGSIESKGTTKGYGIVADNDGSGSSSLTINSGSLIDLSSVTNAAVGDLVGIYAKNTVVNSSGDITIGKNGIVMYAEDSNVTISGGTINITGDNVLGFYLKGATTFSGSGTINVSGQGVTIFNLNTNPGMAFTNLFTINTIGSGTYTLGSIANGSYYYNNATTLGGNGAMVSGKSSTVLFDSGANIGTTGDSNIGIYVDGVYTGGAVPGFTAGIEAENRGIITLNNSSAGLYGLNGASVYNAGGTITVGNDSTGIYASGGTSNAMNTGNITVGSNSQGIYLKDGILAANTAGNILSAGTNSVGIYADNISGGIINGGVIDLSGDKSVGIYATGPAKNIVNTGTIKVGNSTELNNPSIGIYTTTPGDIVTNSSVIDSGKNSIGIYAEGATVNQNGTSVVGETGTGIYTKGGTVVLGFASDMQVGMNEAVGVYGTNGTYIVNSSMNPVNIGNGGYGFILETGSVLDNHGILALNGKGTGVYSDGANIVNNLTGADINMTGDNNIGIYMVSGGTINNDANINGTPGKSNIGIYNKNGTITNSGTISVGASVLAYNSDGTVDYDNSGYAVGIYGEGSNINNTGQINIGENGIGLYTRDNPVKIVNKGNITGVGNGATGIFVDNGIVENDAGVTISMTGDNTTGMVANKNGTIINNGNIIMTGNDVTAMFANITSTAINNGVIDMSGATGNSVAFLLGAGSTYVNNVGSTLNLGLSGTLSGRAGITHDIPSIINGGIIQSDGVLALDGISISLKVDPSTVVYQSDPTTGPQFIANGASIVADTLITDKPIIILPGFADGTNANVYKIVNAVKASGGIYEFISGSLLWEAIPEATGTGADVYMKRKSFTDFTDGLWFEDFGNALEEKFLGSSGDAMKIYNKTAYIKTEEDFRQIMASLAGNVYANINQRENDIAEIFENSLNLISDSANNTKENVKVNVIAGKGKNKEETDGVVPYDYTTAGVLALREVERTYRHTFGYSLGYLHTGFEFNDGNESEEWVDTIQLGVHSKYNAGGWKLRNDLTGRASIHNVDRNIEWGTDLGRSEMNGTYETYSITSDNILGKEFGLGKRVNITPYGAFKAMYVTRPTFKESGLERLEVDGNDAWSVKPRAGVELNAAVPLGSQSPWQLKGTLDFAYEYELADLNEREKARLVAVEDNYHKLSKPEDEKGTFRTKAYLGVEVADRYGIFLTGEYKLSEHDKDDYRAGVILKAVF